jgi:hypothetical protein
MLEFIPLFLELTDTYGYKAERIKEIRGSHKKWNLNLITLLHIYYKSYKDIRVEFTGKNLSKFGGISILRKFLIRLGVKEELESAIPIQKRKSKFPVGEMIVCLLYGVILDMKRQSA